MCSIGVSKAENRLFAKNSSEAPSANTALVCRLHPRMIGAVCKRLHSSSVMRRTINCN